MHQFNLVFFIALAIVLSIAAGWCLRQPPLTENQKLAKRYRKFYDTRLGILRVLGQHSVNSSLYRNEPRLSRMRFSLRLSMAECLVGRLPNFDETEFYKPTAHIVEIMFYQILNEDANSVRKSKGEVYYDRRELNAILNPKEI